MAAIDWVGLAKPVRHKLRFVCGTPANNTLYALLWNNLTAASYTTGTGETAAQLAAGLVASYNLQTDARITSGVTFTQDGTTLYFEGHDDGAPFLNPGRTGAAVVYTELVAADGPYHDSNVLNYSGGALPVNGDTLMFRGGTNLTGPRYGTAMSAVEFAEIIVDASYQGSWGLPDNRGPYREIRNKRWQQKAVKITIDNGNGTTANRFRTKCNQPCAIVARSNSRVSALDVDGVANGLTITLTNCGITIGGDTLPGGTAEFSDLVATNCAILVGPGFTLDSISVTNGTVTNRGTVTSIMADASVVNQFGGSTTLNGYNGSLLNHFAETGPGDIDLVDSRWDLTGATAEFAAPSPFRLGGACEVTDPQNRLTQPWEATINEGSQLGQMRITTGRGGTTVTVG